MLSYSHTSWSSKKIPALSSETTKIKEFEAEDTKLQKQSISEIAYRQAFLKKRDVPVRLFGFEQLTWLEDKKTGPFENRVAKTKNMGQLRCWRTGK